jgi:general stress protein 26
MENPKIAALEKAYDKRLTKDYITNLKREVKELSREELGEQIRTFLEENCICTLATCSDNIPRATILRYKGKGMKIYILTEGGGKMHNIRENPQGSVTVCAEYNGFLSVKGVQVWGRAEIVKSTDPAFEEGYKIINITARQDLKEAGLNQDIPDMFLLRIDIERARLLSFPDAIINQSLWLK